MRKSYVLEHSMKVKVEMDLGEVGDLIKDLSDRVGTNDREPRSLINLKKIRREAAEEAARTFKTMCEQDQVKETWGVSYPPSRWAITDDGSVSQRKKIADGSISQIELR